MEAEAVGPGRVGEGWCPEVPTSAHPLLYEETVLAPFHAPGQGPLPPRALRWGRLLTFSKMR